MADNGRPVTGVGLILVDPGGRVLLGHRITAGEAPSWSLPGGHVEAGETWEQAAAREAAEEAGIEGTAPAVFAVGVRTRGSGVTAAAVAEWPGTPPRLLEPHAFDAWTWCDPDDLPGPLYEPSAMALATWRGRPAPDGWRVYRVTA
ncbi:NUDIX domain-containing protein [Pseudosporangium ferrugineum]|uniref:ADP-ribose pyrophosphatase YjhB (NUDIX family) n=1 Tax=Pseudosporangium ferrugineum TaxID=439699 RepID=A0A2T0RX81_9ACTN|nr:NUDIX domain-containing protein [Pseudosporangium ferrugineum]PRY25757.1 ADP-ribose pyrophosphatase YjhB (NUDIX family) [Pseudosporangium ferrugineum]